MTTKLKSNMFPTGSAFKSPIISGVFNVGGRSYNDPVAVSYNGLITLDFSTSCNFTVPLTDNIQLGKPTGLSPGQSGVIILSQGAVGTSTVSFNNVWKFVNGGIPIISTGAYVTSVLVYYVESADRITAQVLASGAESMFQFNRTITVNTLDYNLRTDALASGWNGNTPINATVTVASGVVLGASTTSTFGFSTGGFSASSSNLTLINNGYIVGCGGAGGYGVGPSPAGEFGGGSGGAGGHAMNITSYINITNNGVIGGGGGGGGGTGGGSVYPDWGGAGGGGAGYVPGIGGVPTSTAYGAQSGNPGTLLNGGLGGACGAYDPPPYVPPELPGGI